jgi:hypothetical protein
MEEEVGYFLSYLSVYTPLFLEVFYPHACTYTHPITNCCIYIPNTANAIQARREQPRFEKQTQPDATMSEEDALRSSSSGAVGSRFVTEKEVTSAREKKDEEWKAAYAR